MNTVLLASTLADAITYATASVRMPDFSEVMGEPLDGAQIESLVPRPRRRGRAPSRPPAAGGVSPPAAR